MKGRRRRGRQKKRAKTIFKAGQEWTLPAQTRWKVIVRSHLWCPYDFARLCDRTDSSGNIVVNFMTLG